MDNALTIIKNIKGGFAAGISGGADSMCLLSLVLKAGRGGDCTVINVDHGIRENSAADSLFVRDFCLKHGVKFVGRKIDVPSSARLSGRSVETEARIMRHAIFNEFCEEHNVPLLLAHNKGDNAESVLMHIFRGCGIRGLAGMSAYDGMIIRPLIHLDKAGIYQYLRQSGIPHVEDETNSDLGFSRNRIRALLAEAEKSFSGALGAIESLSKIAKDNLRFVESRLDGDYLMRDGGGGKGAVLLDKRALDGEFGLFLAGEYVYKAARLVGLDVDLEQKHIAAVIALAGLQVGKSIDLPHGLRVYNQHDFLAFQFFVPPPDAVKSFENRYGEQEVGGVKISVLPVDLADLKGFGWDFLPPAGFTADRGLTVSGFKTPVTDFSGSGFKTPVTDFSGNNFNMPENEINPTDKDCKQRSDKDCKPPFCRCFVDLDRLFGAELRFRREGDRFWPCGGRAKKLKEFLSEKRVPLRVRDRLPLIALGDEVLVILGLRISEKVKITAETRRAAEIRVEE